jgi:hypothetical protein
VAPPRYCCGVCCWFLVSVPGLDHKTRLGVVVTVGVGFRGIGVVVWGPPRSVGGCDSGDLVVIGVEMEWWLEVLR